VRKKIAPLLFGRTARNLYFWGAVTYIRLSNFDYGYSVDEVIYCLALLLPLLTGIYLNNLLLIPRLLERKKYLPYFAINIALLFADMFYSLRIIKQQLHHPEIAIYKTVWVPMSKEALNELPVLGMIHVMAHGFLILVFALCWYARDYSIKKREIAAIRKQQMETELAFLKSQLNPHFLFNTLNNLYGLTLKGTGGAASGAILQLSAILRYLLYESNVPLVSFKREQEIMQAYIELELLRLPEMDNLVFSMNADRDYMVPPLLWLPVLENVFKHSRYSANAAIEFRCYIRDHEMHMFAQNNYDPGTQAEKGGIGMDNLRKRLQLLFPGKHSIESSQNDSLYSLDIKIQLHETTGSTDRR